MTWSEQVDRAFARRREELLRGMLEDGKRVVRDVDAMASACVSRHPYLALGGALVAGAGGTVGTVLLLRHRKRTKKPAPARAPAAPAGSAQGERKGQRKGTWSKLLSGAWRLLPIGMVLLTG